MTGDTFTIGKCNGSKPRFMNFLYDLHEHKVLQGWEYPSSAERNQFHTTLKNMNGPNNIAICKGSMKNGRITLEATPEMCPCCLAGH